jgi:hypothetical protein
MSEWYSDPALRKRCQAGLNKGEAAHKLKRAVSAIVLWNTVYLARAVAHLRGKGHVIPESILPYVSPLAWEHINLTGIYSWDAPPLPAGGFRPLRTPGQDFSQAA